MDDDKTDKTDKTIECKDCRKSFVWSVGEQEYFEQKGFDKVPRRCKPCRKFRRAEMGEIYARGERYREGR